jgi:hypothetical protein
MRHAPPPPFLLLFILLFAHTLPPASAQTIAQKIEALPAAPPAERADWLLGKVERKAGVYKSERSGCIVLDNGLIRRVFATAPNAATIALDQLVSGASLLRTVTPECEVTIDNMSYKVGGLMGAPVQNYLSPDWLGKLDKEPLAFQFESFEFRPVQERFPWKRQERWMSSRPEWPPAGVELILYFGPPDSRFNLSVAVHYELYDGIPLLCKWFELFNGGDAAVRINTFRSEVLAMVEASSEVEENPRPKLPNIHVETDFTKVSMMGETAARDTAIWQEDSTYGTQVNYRLKSPCNLVCRPPLGPDYSLEPRDTFTSFRTWILAFDDEDAVRKSLSLAKMYRTIAPWIAENPLIFHARSAEPVAVREAVDQAAEAGFEIIILTFGSGFDVENEDPKYGRQMKELSDYAKSKGIALGGYSLLASRSAGPENDVVNPATGKPGGFAIFGDSPCLGSPFGIGYFRKLVHFFEATGFEILEHDGSYPGDACASTAHPGHRGLQDSRWTQWKTITDFYKWCRGRGIYLNVPDWYFLSGSSKTGMGYRETNWSLPREFQEIIERQNIHDGTRYKTPTMGWMFVPLTEYHGGGKAATIEPLDEHLDHYERRLLNLFGAGVQACFRGPRLFDTERTKSMVKRRVEFYKKHRAVLESDLVPLRRADGRDWDGWLHVAPGLEEKGLAMIYNPLDVEVERTIRVPLYYSGIRGKARVALFDFKAADAAERVAAEFDAALDARQFADVSCRIPARSAIGMVFRQASSIPK